MDNENLWHIHELIFGYLDHNTVEICRKVCKSWNESLKRISIIIYLLEFGDRVIYQTKEKVSTFFPGWKKAVEKYSKQASNEDLLVVKDSIRKLERDEHKCLYLSFLHQAAGNGAVKLMEIILKTSVNLNAIKYSSGDTALHLACKNGKTELVELLIKSSKNCSIDLNAREDKGCTALHLACENGRTETVKLLIKSSKIFSIDLNAKDVENEFTPFHLACECGRTEIVELMIKLSKDFNIDLNDRDDRGRTALYSACHYGRTETVELMIKSSKVFNIDLNTREDDDGWTAFHLACLRGRTEIVELMIKSSKDFDIDLNYRDVRGWTAFHRACQNGHIETVHLMMKNWKEFGIDIKAQDNEGKTPLDIARIQEDRYNMGKFRIRDIYNENRKHIIEMLEIEYSKMDDPEHELIQMY